LDVRLLNHGDKRLLGRAARLEERREVTAAPQLRDPQIDRAGARLPEPIAVAVAAVAALPGPLAVLGAGALLDLEVHKPPGDVAQELPDDIVLGPLFNELSECHTDLGHRGVLS